MKAYKRHPIEGMRECHSMDGAPANSTGSASELVGHSIALPLIEASRYLLGPRASRGPQQSSSAGVPCLPAMSASARKDQPATAFNVTQSTQHSPTARTFRAYRRSLQAGMPALPGGCRVFSATSASRVFVLRALIIIRSSSLQLTSLLVSGFERMQGNHGVGFT
jgi:hypothetical protein